MKHNENPNAPLDKTDELESDLAEHQIAYDDLSRREVRSLIFHLLYAMESFDYEESLSAIVDNLNRGFNLAIPLNSELVKITDAIVQLRDELDAMSKPLLANWRFDRLGICTKLILRFALWELKYTDTDPRIVINEAVELAKCFAEKDAFRFINGVLDRVVKARETQQNKP